MKGSHHDKTEDSGEAYARVAIYQLERLLGVPVDEHLRDRPHGEERDQPRCRGDESLRGLVPMSEKDSPRRSPLVQVLVARPRPREGIAALDDDVLLPGTFPPTVRCTTEAAFGRRFGLTVLTRALRDCFL